MCGRGEAKIHGRTRLTSDAGETLGSLERGQPRMVCERERQESPWDDGEYVETAPWVRACKTFAFARGTAGRLCANL